MKLLLTSAGLSNKSISDALFRLVGKPAADTSLVFIPTASNLEIGDKDWLITDLINLKKQGFKSIEITDISAVGEDIWRPSLDRSDIIYFEGGNTYHLMRWLNRSGLSDTLSDILRDKVYVGVSAGSMVTGPDMALKLSQQLYEEDMIETEVLPGLGYVDFYFLPHLNSEYFSKFNRENLEKVADDIPKKIYALDDDSALSIVDGKVEVVSQGEWFVLNSDGV
jgi:dipeptidase E